MIRAERAGTPATGIAAGLLRFAAGFTLRALPRNHPSRVGSAFCAITSASVLAYVRRSVTVGGLAAGANAVIALVPEAGLARTDSKPPQDQRTARWIASWSSGENLRATCLPRSLAMWAVLQADGYPAVFCMGASNKSLTEPSHAWVECEGEPLLERDDPRELYTRFDLANAYPARLVGGAKTQG